MKLDFEKGNGLIPAIIQHAQTGQVLMLGYMNEEAFQHTQKTGLLTFFSRSKNRLWTKGETSGNTLKLVSLQPDCDQDTLLIQALPSRPVCHTGSFACFGAKETKGFLYELENTIQERKKQDPDKSYTARLFSKGLPRIAQKVGEEATESIVAALAEGKNKLRDETADLLYHLIVLLQASDLTLEDVETELKKRSEK